MMRRVLVIGASSSGKSTFSRKLRDKTKLPLIYRMNAISTYPFYIMGGDWGGALKPHSNELPLKGDTIIGNDVWIGQNITILPGVHIGDGAIIGANSVVSRDVESYAIAVGNPCRVKKFRFSKEKIEILEEVKWWDWDIEKIERNFPIIDNGDIEALRNIK